jgi:hypothetical protein
MCAFFDFKSKKKKHPVDERLWLSRPVSYLNPSESFIRLATTYHAPQEMDQEGSPTPVEDPDLYKEEEARQSRRQGRRKLA